MVWSAVWSAALHQSSRPILTVEAGRRTRNPAHRRHMERRWENWGAPRRWNGDSSRQNACSRLRYIQGFAPRIVERARQSATGGRHDELAPLKTECRVGAEALATGRTVSLFGVWSWLRGGSQGALHSPFPPGVRSPGLEWCGASIRVRRARQIRMRRSPTVMRSREPAGTALAATGTARQSRATPALHSFSTRHHAGRSFTVRQSEKGHFRLSRNFLLFAARDVSLGNPIRTSGTLRRGCPPTLQSTLWFAKSF